MRLYESKNDSNITVPICGGISRDKISGGMAPTPWVGTDPYSKINTFTWNQDINFWEMSPEYYQSEYKKSKGPYNFGQ